MLPMSSNSITRKKINGGVEGLLKRVKTPGTVDVGIIDEGLHDESDVTVAQIFFWNEFGTETIPERSVMRSTIKEKKKEIIALQKKLLKRISDGSIDVNTALGLVGELMADFIRQKIVSIKSPPNAPSTIAAKGSSNPFIASGQSKNSITYEVNR